MDKISLLDMIEALATCFEERVLDQNCADNKMQWDVYITKILNGWTPDNLLQVYWLECYRLAIKKLQKSGRKTTGSSLTRSS